MGRASHELGGGGDEGSGRDGGCSLKKPRRRKGEKGCPPPSLPVSWITDRRRLAIL